MNRLMTEDEQEQMDECAKRVAGVRFNIAVLKQDLIAWVRRLKDVEDQQDIRNRADHFIDVLQKGLARDTGRVQRRGK